MRIRLELMPMRAGLRDLYGERANYASDSGMDLVIPTEHVIPPGALGYKIPLGVAAAPTDGTHGYYLYPRSSIVKTPLRLANSVGIIDASYRGEIMAVVDHRGDAPYTVTAGSRLFQLCMPDLCPFDVAWVDDLTRTERGAGGFGSTGVA